MKNQYCIYCLEDIQQNQTLINYFVQDSKLCGNCLKALESAKVKTQFCGHPLYINYVYNTFLEGMLFQYKEGRDIALKEVFLFDILKDFIKKYQKYTLVFMPSSTAKKQERGFESLKELFERTNIKYIEPFYKTEDYKQSLHHFKDRQKIQDVMFYDCRIKLPKTPLLLVDDVCTSGSTLKRAYELLPVHIYKVEAFVISATPLFLDSMKKRSLIRKVIGERINAWKSKVV